MQLVILVTGCAGFIGSHLTDRLLNTGYRVIGVDNFDSFYDRTSKERNLQQARAHSDFVFIEGDLLQTDWLQRLAEPVDVVIHLAAKAGVRPSIEHPDEYILTNVVGTNKLLDWMRANGTTKMVFASSSSVYGNNEKTPFAETDSVDGPISPYAFTKRTCELLNYTNHHLYGMSIVNLRFFTVYGERQRPDLAIHKLVKLIACDKPFTMYGSGESLRDYTYITDIIDGIVGALNYVTHNPPVYEIINLGNNNPVTLRTLVNTIYRLMEKEPNIVRLPKQAGDVEKTCADISKAARLLAYSPKVSLEEGLVRFIEWHNAETTSAAS